MAQRKTRAVFNADPEQFARVLQLVRAGEYASTSAFLRDAIGEKLRELENQLMAAQLDRACDAAGADDDSLLHSQAWDE